MQRGPDVDDADEDKRIAKRVLLERGAKRSLISPVIDGPRPLPMSVWMNSSNDVATERMRSVASACVMANDGPKNTAAMNIRPTNEGSTTARSGDRYARN